MVWLTTEEASAHIGAPPHILFEIRRELPEFPIRKVKGQGRGMQRLTWPSRNLNLMKHLHANGLTWMAAARVSIIGEFGRTFVIRRPK